MKATNIVWDFDGPTTNSLPTEVDIPLSPKEFDSYDEFIDKVSDWLSDEYGFCHFGFRVRKG